MSGQDEPEAGFTDPFDKRPGPRRVGRARLTSLRNAAISLVVGALFGLVISTNAPPHHSAIAGVGAGTFIFGSFQHFDRMERRAATAAARRSEDEAAADRL